jgi:DNA adenine methylase
LLPIILAVFPNEYGRYIEVFGGSGAVLLGKEESRFEVYNDVDSELVNCFRVIRNRPAELLLELDLLPLNSREDFMCWLHFHNGGNEPEQYLERQEFILDNQLPKTWAKEMKATLSRRADYRTVRQAAAYLMRVRNSYSSSGRSFACQPFNIRSLFDQILEMSFRLANVVIEQQSFEVLIPHYDREDAFFYADPPYFDSEYVYDAEFDWDHHVLLRDTLAKCKGKWLISQVDCPEIRELFKDFDVLDFKRIHPMVQKYTPGKQFGELLIGNYDLLEREREVPIQMSLNELLGEPINVEQILKERVRCKKRAK